MESIPVKSQGSSAAREGSSMADNPAAPDSRSVAALRQQAAMAPTYAEQQYLVTEAENAQQIVLRQAALDREVDLVAANTTEIVPGRVHELHTAGTDWLGEIPTSPDAIKAAQHMVARGTVWYQNLPLAVRADTDEFVAQAQGYARRTAGFYGDQVAGAEQAFFEHVATLRDRDARGGIFTAADAPMPSQPGDPAGTFTSGGGQNWIDGDATSSNRAPQLQELATESPSQDVVPENDPGLGSASPDPAVAAQERTGARHTAVDAKDLEAFPRCAKCNQPVGPIEMAHTADNKPVHGSCVGITGSNQEGHQMQTAPCPTCGTGRVAVRQAPQPSIAALVTGGHHVAYSGLPQVDQVVDPSDTTPTATPLPEEVAFPWTVTPGQVENTIGEAEQQLAERETRKGAMLRRQASQAATQAYGLTYNEVVRQGMARFDPQGTFDPLVRHATLARQAQSLGQQAAQEAMRLVFQAGQDDSGWLGDMGQGGVTPGQQDGGNPPSTNLGAPDPVYGYGGDNPNTPLKPYGADEADDYTNNPGQNWQPGQPLQDDLGGRGYSTEAPAGGGMQPARQGSISALEANDPQLQAAGRFMRSRREFIRQHAQVQRTA